MRIRNTATRLGALVGAAALLGGLALSAGVAGVGAQTGTATPAPTASGPTPASNVGGPSAVPSARFFGAVNGTTGTSVTASIGGVACGFGTVSGGQYFVDVQAIQGCIAPGSAVSFTVGGQAATASPAASLPPIPGTAVLANLTVAAATAAPTAAPTTASTTVPPPPPPPPPKTASPTPTRAPVSPTATRPPATPTAAQRPAAPAAQAAKPAAPAAQAARPGAAAAAPAARPALPNTGTGGLASTERHTASVALLGILLGALALGVTGLVTYRKAR